MFIIEYVIKSKKYDITVHISKQLFESLDDPQKLKIRSGVVMYGKVPLKKLLIRHYGVIESGNLIYMKEPYIFTLNNLNIYQMRIYPDYLMFTDEEFNGMVFHKTVRGNNSKVGWVYNIYKTKKHLVFRFFNDRYGVEVHAILDKDIQSRFDIYRMSVKYDGHTRGYYMEYTEKRLHRLMMDCPNDLQVDHLNLVTTDNRRENLRIVNNRQNCMNQGIRRDNSSGVKGVTCEYSDGKVIKFKSEIRVNGKSIKRSFSVNKYGYDNAFKMAFDERRKMESVYGYRSSCLNSR